MIFNAKQFLDDHNIQYKSKGADTHKGWVQIKCPFCGDFKYHGGFNLKKGSYHCWICGYHSVYDIIKILINPPSIKKILKQYFNINDKDIEIIDKFSIKNNKVNLPGKKLKDQHINYLINRNFDHERLERKWNILGTDNIGTYKFRIIAPIYLNHKLISFQGRDITNKSSARYKACPIEKEVYHHKYSLYGIDNVFNDKAIIVEGITDVWRLGYGSICTFGIEYTIPQISLLVKSNIKDFFIIFDKQDEAQEKANELGISLQSFNKNVEIITLDNVEDPALLSPSEALYYKKQLIGDN